MILIPITLILVILVIYFFPQIQKFWIMQKRIQSINKVGLFPKKEISKMINFISAKPGVDRCEAVKRLLKAHIEILTTQSEKEEGDNEMAFNLFFSENGEIKVVPLSEEEKEAFKAAKKNNKTKTII